MVIALLIIAATAIYMSSTPKKGPQPSYSLLAVKLTDPPHVPAGTEWLNVTFTQIALLVGEPTGTGGQVNVVTVMVTPQGGSATIDLLALQNYTQTLAVANITQGSIVYSATFTVSSIEIKVNGTQYNVTLAGGSNTLQAVIANPQPLTNGSELLVELNPIVVLTPGGYQLIPSTVAVLVPSVGKPHEGEVSNITAEEEQELEEARGSLNVTVLSLTAQGNTTTLTLLANNTGNISVRLVAVSLHGDFNVTGSACKAGEHGGQDHENQSEDNSSVEAQQGDDQSEGVAQAHASECEHPDEVVFVPVNTSTTSTNTSTTTTSTTTVSGKCLTVGLRLVGGGSEDDESQGDQEQMGGITIQPGQCVQLTFNGTITFGHLTLVPSLTPGSTYTLHVMASNGAEQKLSCSVPVGPASCVPERSEED